MSEINGNNVVKLIQMLSNGSLMGILHLKGI